MRLPYYIKGTVRLETEPPKRDNIPMVKKSLESILESSESVEYGVFWGADLFRNLQPKEALIEHILYQSDAICISAGAGVGKSIFTLQMMAALTSGKPFLDSFTVSKPCNVLYFQTEGDRIETINNLASMAKGVAIDHDRWVHINLDGITLNTKEGHEIFMELALKPKMSYDVIIFDPLYTTVKGSLTSDEVATDWVRSVRGMRNKFPKCAFVMVNHEGKTQFSDGKAIPKGAKDIFGSTFWSAFVSYNFKLRAHANGDYVLDSGKERTKYVVDKLEMHLVEPEPLMYIIANADVSVKETQILKLIEESKEPVLPKSLIKSVEVSRATVFRILRKLLDLEKIQRVGEGSSVRYRAIG